MPGPVRRKSTKAVAIDPTKQEQAGPIPAAIVADKRDTLPRRLTKLALIVAVIVLLGYVINGQIDTHRQLKSARHDRDVLIDDVTRLARIMGRQGFDLRALRQAIIDQNKILRRAGLPTIPVPPLTSEGGGAHDGGQSSTPRSHPSESASPSSHPSHHPPSNQPGPSPSHPVVICLPVVHCITPGGLRQLTVLDWEAILARAMLEDTP